jgi:hypothetical protein
MGQIWEVSNTDASNATLATVQGLSSSTPTVTFTSSQIQFDSRLNNNNAANYTISSFLNSQGTTTTFGSPKNGLSLSDALNKNGGGTLAVFTGFANFKTGDTFTFAHDDGFQFYVGGVLVENDPGPTPPTPTNVTYTGPSGLLAFTIVYGECCGAPAVLDVNLNGVPITSPTPEPASLSLIGIALAGLVVYRRRKVA